MPLDLHSLSEQVEDYLHGVGDSVPVRVNNLLLFVRRSKRTLQQRSLENLSHHRHVLLWALETEGVVSVDGVALPLLPGQGFLIQPYQFHHYINLKKSKLSWLFVTFELDAGESALKTLEFLRLKMDDVVENLLQQMIDCWQARASASSVLVCQNLLERLLLHLLMAGSGAGSEDSSGLTTTTALTNLWFVRAERLLRENTSQANTLSVVAAKLGVSERTFRDRFQAIAGVTPHRYRTHYLLQQAMRLIRSDVLSITAIAEQLGFGSSAVFTRFIKRETGKTPIELRKNARIQLFVPKKNKKTLVYQRKLLR